MTDSPPAKKQKTMAADTPSAPSPTLAAPAKFAPPIPPILLLPTSTPAQLIAHGAEGHLYKTTHYVASSLLPLLFPTSSSSLLGTAAALKYRPPKQYRHPVLDARLTRHRILSEARILARCRRDGVAVPAVLAIDETAGWLLMEWVAGEVVRAAINRWLAATTGPAAVIEGKEPEQEYSGPLRDLIRKMGQAVGALHKSGVVHGDLTTSNMMLRPLDRQNVAVAVADGDTQGDGILAGEVVIIDFGLASQSSHEEDRAVDLYVLERAFGSTHPSVEHIFAEEFTPAYSTAYKAAATVLKRLDDVRLRGRKKSMLG